MHNQVNVEEIFIWAEKVALKTIDQLLCFISKMDACSHLMVVASIYTVNYQIRQTR